MAQIHSYKELIVWQRGMELVKEAYLMLNAMPAEEKYILTQQMKRSAISVPSNIAEGWGRKSRKSYLHFLRIASGSLYEFETCLMLCIDLSFLSKERTERLNDLIQEMVRMLSSMIIKLEEKFIETE